MAFELDGQEIFVDTDNKPVDILQYEMVEFGDFMPTQSKPQYLTIALNMIPTWFDPTPAPETDERIAICGYGPSLLDEIETLKAGNYRTVFTTSGAHDVLVSHGITPSFHVEIDWKPHKSKFTKKANDTTMYIVSAICHPDTIINVHDKNCALIFLPHGPEIIYPDPDFVCDAGYDAGQQCIVVAHKMGFRNMDLFGFDQSFKDEDGERHAGDHGGRIHYMMPVTVKGRLFYTSKTMFTSLLTFHYLAKQHPELNLTIHGDGLLPNFMEAKAELKD